MLNGVTYAEVEIQSTLLHLIEKLLGNYQKITDQLLFKNLLVNGGGGRVALFCSRTLQVGFCNNETNFRKLCLYCVDNILN